MAQGSTTQQSLSHSSATAAATTVSAPSQGTETVASRGTRKGFPWLSLPQFSRSPRSGGPIKVRSLPLLIGAGIVVSLFALAMIGAAGVRVIERGRLYDNIYVNDENLGGLTQADARTKLTTALVPVIDAPVTLSYNGRQWTPKRAELGIRPDVDATVAEAYTVGRSGGPIGQLWRVAQMKTGAKSHVPLSVVVNQPIMDSYFDRLQTDIGMPPVDASVAIKNGMVAVTPGKDGVRLDRDQVRGQVEGDLAHLQHTALTLAITFSPPNVSTDTANAAKARIEDWVSAPLVLTFNGKKWELSHDLLLAGVRIGPGPQFSLSLDPAVFAAKVNTVANELQQNPVDATIGWDNALVVRKSAQNGQRLNGDETLKRIAGWQGGDRTIPLPVEVALPRIPDDVSKLGITTRIALGISNFAGSDAARAKNITVAAGFLDNTVVGPGDTFSFLDAIGEISKERGYKEGYVILAEETVPGIGGGVCQVATTMFRAAMYSGLPIVDRNPHAYLVSYYQQGGYPVGLDAAVFSPDVDLKFQNTTNSYLLIKTSVDGGGNLYVSMYGPDLGYSIDISDPVISNKKPAPDDEYQINSSLPAGTKKQVEFAKSGESVVLTRVVKDKTGNVVRDAKFFTNYQAWPNKFLVSPDRAPGHIAQATTAPIRPTTQATSGTTAAKATQPASPPTMPTPSIKVTSTPAVVMPTKATMPTPVPAKTTAKT